MRKNSKKIREAESCRTGTANLSFALLSLFTLRAGHVSTPRIAQEPVRELSKTASSRESFASPRRSLKVKKRRTIEVRFPDTSLAWLRVCTVIKPKSEYLFTELSPEEASVFSLEPVENQQNSSTPELHEMSAKSSRNSCENCQKAREGKPLKNLLKFLVLLQARFQVSLHLLYEYVRAL